MNCTTACMTRDHASWGECLRSKGIRLGDLKGESDVKITDRRLNAYADARRQGLQPPTTKLADSLGTVRAAGG